MKQAKRGSVSGKLGAEVTNADRAVWARRALATLQQDTGLTDADGLDTALTDLLCDLMHFCDQAGLEFEQNLIRAQMHYSAEAPVDSQR